MEVGHQSVLPYLVKFFHFGKMSNSNREIFSQWGNIMLVFFNLNLYVERKKNNVLFSPHKIRIAEIADQKSSLVRTLRTFWEIFRKKMGKFLRNKL